jgi:hypothetical protein
MTVLRDYEQEVVRLLTQRVLSPHEIDSVIREGELVEYDYTGCGYFLTIRHPTLPVKRVVCDEPKLAGTADGIDSGFVIFIQNGQLTLECHSWGDIDVPEWFRDREVQVAEAF